MRDAAALTADSCARKIRDELGLSMCFFPSLRGYERPWLRGDLIAGLTLWAVLVPQALAYASIARVSPVVGLYAAPGALLLYAALGSSRVLVVGPMAAVAALSAATVADLVPAGDSTFAAFTAGLALTTGVAALIAGLLRLGFLADFISQPVLKGFIIGLALTIMIGQLPKLFGISATHGDFFEQAWHFIAHVRDTQGLTLLVGALSLAVIVGLRRVAPGVPGPLVAVAGAIGAVKAFGLDVPTVGSIASGLPSLGLPDIGLGDVGELAAGGIGVMLIAFAEGLGAANAFAARKDRPIDANRELVALGCSNLASGLSSGMVVSGSLSKTAVNASAGARTQVSTLLAAALTVVALLFLTGLFEDLPEATLAAVVIAAVIELVDVPALVDLYDTYTTRLGRQFGWVARPDFLAAVAALLGVTISSARCRACSSASVPRCCCSSIARRGPTSRCSAARPTPAASTATSTVITTRAPQTASSSCGSRAACTSPTLRTSARASSTSAVAKACTP